MAGTADAIQGGMMTRHGRFNDELNPSYYSGKNIQPIEVIEDWDLSHHLACAVKYIARHGLKGDREKSLMDLRKAVWYIERKIQNVSDRVHQENGGENE